MTQERLVILFNAWMDRYIANPEEFDREFQAVTQHIAERANGEDLSYGQKCAAYLAKLDGELPQ